MKNLFLILALIILIVSCEESESPNSLGGKSDIDLTEPGSEFGVYISMDNMPNSPFEYIEDDVTVKSREGGIVTFDAKFSIDEENLKRIDTLLGTQDFSDDIKRQVVDSYLEIYNATIDSSDKNNITLTAEVEGKVTDEGIQNFIKVDGVNKPFTIIKYSASVGDKYTFVTEDGKEIVRTVKSKSTDDDYELGFIYIKVFEIEEVSEDPLVEKITYYANHKFGLVGVKLTMKSGNVVQSKILPWDIL